MFIDGQRGPQRGAWRGLKIRVSVARHVALATISKRRCLSDFSCPVGARLSASGGGRFRFVSISFAEHERHESMGTSVVLLGRACPVQSEVAVLVEYVGCLRFWVLQQHGDAIDAAGRNR
jgi:hypothetical protein